MLNPYRVTKDIDIIPSHAPVAGVGFLPVNAFVIKAQDPVLVDTGMAMEREAFMAALSSIIDPRDLKWVWLTHDDSDHAGNLQKVLEIAPHARLALNSLAALRISEDWPLPWHRLHWLNPGDSIMAGDHKLTAVRPPLFDNPTTIGIYDDKLDTFFSADCFGAIIPSRAKNIEEVAEKDLVQGMMLWASGDTPWVHLVEQGAFGQTLEKIRHIAPKMILSGHLPPARGKTERFLELLAKVPASPPFVAFNQQALEQILAQKKA